MVGNHCKDSRPIVADLYLLSARGLARRELPARHSTAGWRSTHPPRAIDLARIFARSPLLPTPAPTVLVAPDGSRSLHLAGSWAGAGARGQGCFQVGIGAWKGRIWCWKGRIK